MAGGNCTGEACDPRFSVLAVLDAERWTGGADIGIADGCGTVMGWLHPGQETVFPNAGSETFRVLLQWGQYILKAIGSTPIG
jgi:hypothetical protein